MIEQTLSIVKPDAVERNFVDRIKSFFKEETMGKLKLFLLIVCIFAPSLLFGAKKTETIKAKSMT